MNREEVPDEPHKEPGEERKDSELEKSENSDLDESLNVSAEINCNGQRVSVFLYVRLVHELFRKRKNKTKMDSVLMSTWNKQQKRTTCRCLM